MCYVSRIKIDFHNKFRLKDNFRVALKIAYLVHSLSALCFWVLFGVRKRPSEENVVMPVSPIKPIKIYHGSWAFNDFI